MAAGTTNDLKTSIDKLEKNKERAATLVRQIIAGEVPPEKEAPPPAPKPVAMKPKVVEIKKEEPVETPKLKKLPTERVSLLRTKEELAELERKQEEARKTRSSDPTTIKLDFSGVQSKVAPNLRTKEELTKLEKQKEEAQKQRPTEISTIKLDFSGVTSKVAPLIKREDGEVPKDEKPKPEATPEPEKKPLSGTCAQCGAKIAGDVKFCTSCGTKRGGAAPAEKKVVVANAGIVRKNTLTGITPTKPGSGGGLMDLMAEINAKAAAPVASGVIDEDETF